MSSLTFDGRALALITPYAPGAGVQIGSKNRTVVVVSKRERK